MATTLLSGHFPSFKFASTGNCSCRGPHDAAPYDAARLAVGRERAGKYLRTHQTARVPLRGGVRGGASTAAVRCNPVMTKFIKMLKLLEETRATESPETLFPNTV